MTAQITGLNEDEETKDEEFLKKQNMKNWEINYMYMYCIIRRMDKSGDKIDKIECWIFNRNFKNWKSGHHRFSVNLKCCNVLKDWTDRNNIFTKNKEFFLQELHDANYSFIAWTVRNISEWNLYFLYETVYFSAVLFFFLFFFCFNMSAE